MVEYPEHSRQTERNNGLIFAVAVVFLILFGIFVASAILENRPVGQATSTSTPSEPQRTVERTTPSAPVQNPPEPMPDATTPPQPATP